MYPNIDLSAWQLALMAVVAMATLIFWLGAVFLCRQGATQARPGRGRFSG